ncbi:MAG: calcium-translocating P-type ATPase, SERCA-type [Candidatus Aenigmarchaeota archaeon]|nr:calcium-translocating P-type ATPase, SERCA-type [Candidatus Aenigmarchaeota archaeon]
MPEQETDKPYYQLSVKQTLEKLQTSKNGLSRLQVRERLHKYGSNVFREEKKISGIGIFLRQFTSILVIILIVASIISALIGNLLDTIVIIIIIILNGVFGFVQEFRAEKAMEALRKLTKPKTIVIRNGKKEEIDSKTLVPGDIVVLEEGTAIPADLRLIESINLKIDEASLTGESAPVEKTVDKFKEVALADRKNSAFLGTVVTYGRGLGIVVKTGMKTEMGRIAKMVQEEEKLTPLQKTLKVFGKNLGLMILGICAIIIVLGIARGGEVMEMVLTGIALAVAAIPEGLPAVVTITLAVGLKTMATKNALIRKLPAVETLGSTSVICADKTGTMTKNEMTVKEVFVNNNNYMVTGSGYTPKGSIHLNGKAINAEKDKALSVLLKTGVLCNNSEFEDNKLIGDPTEAALLVLAKKALNVNEILKNSPRKAEIPFSSERKMMSTVNVSGKKMFMLSKGAVETILDRCTKIQKNDKILGITEKDKKLILNQNKAMAKRALRVLALAYKETKTKDVKEDNLVFIGLVGMIDPPREEVKKDIEICRKAGIKVVMVTGDHADTAEAIAKSLGIITGKGHNVLVGEDLKNMPEEKFRKIVEEIDVYARVEPVQKLKIVEALQSNGHIVAMTGDGVNDAPALKKAQIGIAMGIKGTDVAKEASEIILEDDNFSTIVIAIKEGRIIYDNIKKFIQYMLSANLGEVLIIFLAMLIGFSDPVTGQFLVPLTVIQILWINLVTDGMPALALGVDPGAKDIMEKTPRSPKEKIMSKSMLLDMFIIGIIMAVAGLWLFWSELPLGAARARTVVFTMVVVFEMARVQGVRLKYKVGFFANRKLIYAILGSVVLQIAVVYLPFFQGIFQTVPIGLYDWGVVVLIALIGISVMWIKNKVFS